MAETVLEGYTLKPSEMATQKNGAVKPGFLEKISKVATKGAKTAVRGWWAQSPFPEKAPEPVRKRPSPEEERLKEYRIKEAQRRQLLEAKLQMAAKIKPMPAKTNSAAPKPLQLQNLRVK